MGESLPTDVRARDGSSPVLISADPSHHDIPAGTLPPATEGVSGTDVDSSPSTMTSEDPSAMSPSIWPMPDAVAWVTGGTGHAGSSGVTTIAPGWDSPITIATTSACVGRVLTGYVEPATVRATSAVGSPVRPIIGSSITSIADCSAASEGIP